MRKSSEGFRNIFGQKAKNCPFGKEISIFFNSTKNKRFGISYGPIKWRFWIGFSNSNQFTSSNSRRVKRSRSRSRNKIITMWFYTAPSHAVGVYVFVFNTWYHLHNFTSAQFMLIYLFIQVHCNLNFFNFIFYRNSDFFQT